MERIEERTASTRMPPIAQLYRTVPEDPDFMKLMVENMTFSDYPGAKLGNASSLSSFLMNSNNIAELRASGCLGAILEILRRTDLERDPSSEDVSGLVTSLHIITKGDPEVQRRLMNHPTGLSSVLRLCKHTHGKLQVLSFDMLEWLGKLEMDSQQKLLDRNIIKTLLKPAFMYRSSTLPEVRRRAAQMVRSLTSGSPDRMRIYDFAEICVDEFGERRIEGEMEMLLLSSTVNFLQWWRANKPAKIHVPKIFVLFRHLLAEIIAEDFESIEHMLLILRCCSLVSTDPKHIRFMLANGLGPALQYLVRTDFNLFRPKAKKANSGGDGGGGGGNDRDMLRKIASKFKTKKRSVMDTGERAASTLLFLAMVKPKQGGPATKHHDDINLTVTKYVCNLYENIFTYDTVVIAELVGSGLVPALVFRVGKGKDRDLRFNRFVIHFLHQLFYQVTLAQAHRGFHMSQFKSSVENGGAGSKRAFFWPRGQTPPPPPPPVEEELDDASRAAAEEEAAAKAASQASTTGDDVAAVHARRMKEQSTDLDVVSNTLYAHGVADLLFATLASPLLEDPTVVREGIATLAMMRYAVINDTAILDENRDALFLIYRSRSDCFYQFLFLLCEMIQCTDARPEVLDDLVGKHKAMRILVRALLLSGWVFHEKDIVYRCFGRLAAALPHFCHSLHEVEGGISVVCREVTLRKAKMRQNRRLGAENDDGTEKLLHALREDLGAIKIQSMARRRQAFRRVCVIKGLKDPGAKGRKLVNHSRHKAKAKR